MESKRALAVLFSAALDTKKPSSSWPSIAMGPPLTVEIIDQCLPSRDLKTRKFLPTRTILRQSGGFLASPMAPAKTRAAPSPRPLSPGGRGRGEGGSRDSQPRVFSLGLKNKAVIAPAGV